jgi:hypothetical protein
VGTSAPPPRGAAVASGPIVDDWRGSRHRRRRPRARAFGRSASRDARRDWVVVDLVTDGQSEVVGHTFAGESEDGGARLEAGIDAPSSCAAREIDRGGEDREWDWGERRRGGGTPSPYAQGWRRHMLDGGGVGVTGSQTFIEGVGARMAVRMR